MSQKVYLREINAFIDRLERAQETCPFPAGSLGRLYSECVSTMFKACHGPRDEAYHALNRRMDMLEQAINIENILKYARRLRDSGEMYIDDDVLDAFEWHI